MQGWSPESPVQVGETVTFSASATDDSRVEGFEWDFDGDEEPDAYSAANAPGKSATGSTGHAFSEPASIIPAVRSVDDEGFVSAWDVLEANGSPVELVVGGSQSGAPAVTLNRWDPYSASGPDGSAGTDFTFFASASSDEGIDRIEWDFDGDGAADETTPVSGSSVSAEVSHAYGIAGSWVPKVRAVDAGGLPSLWVAYTVGGEQVMLDTSIPEVDATLTFSQVGETIADGATVSATFSFTVTTDADAASFVWDFGDGNADIETTSPSAQHTYTRRGLFLPTVTIEDGFGTRTLASPVDAGGRPLYVNVLADAEIDAASGKPKTYCSGMTIEELITGGQYNVMDFRSGDKVIIRGTAGADLILGANIQNLVLAGEGNDCIITGGGSDRAFGNAGNDMVFGDSGDERLDGGPGGDICYSGGGRDKLVGCESKLEDGRQPHRRYFVQKRVKWGRNTLDFYLDLNINLNNQGTNARACRREPQ